MFGIEKGEDNLSDQNKTETSGEAQIVSRTFLDMFVFALYWRPIWCFFQVVAAFIMMGVGEKAEILWLKLAGAVLLIWGTVGSHLLRPIVRTLFSAANHNLLGLLMLNGQSSGGLQGAIAEFTRAIELTPNWPMPYNNRAVAYISRKGYEVAINDAKRAIALDAKYSKAFYTVGLAYKAMGRYDDAIQWFSKAHDISEAVPKTVGPTMKEQLHFLNYVAPQLVLVEAVKKEIEECKGRNGNSASYAD